MDCKNCKDNAPIPEKSKEDLAFAFADYNSCRIYWLWNRKPHVMLNRDYFSNNRSIHGGNHHIIAFLNAAIFGSVIVNAAISCNLAVDKYMKIIVLKLIITRH